MHGIVRTKQFTRSLRKLKKSGLFKTTVRTDLETVVGMLAEGLTLPTAYADHPLKGRLREHRECHIKGDLLLLYAVFEHNKVIVLADIGTHSYLFG